jgi:hypothetical protein
MVILQGVSSGESASVGLFMPHRAGDLMIGFAFRDGSVTNPTVPAGWTTITNTLDGTLCSASVAWKIATSSSETSGTWTNASCLSIVVLRNHRADPANNSWLISGSSQVGTSNTINFSSIYNNIDNSLFRVIFLAHVNLPMTFPVPTNMELVGQSGDIICESRTYIGNRPNGTSVTATGTAGAWISYVVPVRASTTRFNNYQGISAGPNNTGIIRVGAGKLQ